MNLKEQANQHILSIAEKTAEFNVQEKLIGNQAVKKLNLKEQAKMGIKIQLEPNQKSA